MGRKLNWGAALGSLAEGLRTYAMMEHEKQQQAAAEKQRKDEIAANRKWQEQQYERERTGRLEDQIALDAMRRGPQIWELPFASTNFEPAGGAGPLAHLPRINMQNIPVYQQDLEGSGSLLGRRLAQMQGWGGDKQEQTYPFVSGGREIPLSAEDWVRFTEARNKPDGSTVNPTLDFARVQAQTKEFLGDRLRIAERLGVDDDIVLSADNLQREGVPLAEAIAKAAAQWLPTPNEDAIAAASNELRPFMPGTVSTGDKTISNAVAIGGKPKVVRSRWWDTPATPPDVVPYDEALTSPEYEGWRNDIAAIIRKRKLTPTDVSTISDRWGLTEKQFYALLAMSNQIQTEPPPEPNDPNDPRNFRRDGGRK